MRLGFLEAVNPGKIKMLPSDEELMLAYRQGEDNAFVRVSTPVSEKSLSECFETISEFVKSFYPVFLDYVENKSRVNTTQSTAPPSS